jgi:predicted phage tail protein
MASLPELTRRALISSTPDLGGCRPGGVEQLALEAQGVALSRLRPLSDYRAAKARAAKSAMAAFLGAVLALGGFYVGWRLGLSPTTSSATLAQESHQR